MNQLPEQATLFEAAYHSPLRQVSSYGPTTIAFHNDGFCPGAEGDSENLFPLRDEFGEFFELKLSQQNSMSPEGKK